ncbi:MAG: hypothetical protein II917_07935 [Synergistaceae bacterium]|nr:hypothetical protein [Synergistaceae bacterium]
MNEKFTRYKWQANSDTGNIEAETGKEYIIANVTHTGNDEEYEANLRLFAHAKDLYYTLLKARRSVHSALHTKIDKLLRKINPNFDKKPEAQNEHELCCLEILQHSELGEDQIKRFLYWVVNILCKSPDSKIKFTATVVNQEE